VNDVLVALHGDVAEAYAQSGRPSIPPERLLRAPLLLAFYTIRSERQLVKQLDYNLLYRWFVGLGVGEPVWVPKCSRRTVTGSSRPMWRGSSLPN
jgi:transposase